MQLPWIHTDIQHPLVSLRCLKASDFEGLLAVAADPLIWAQHPNPLRWQRPIFSTYFEGAILSQGAYLIIHTSTGEWMGCSRYYDWEPASASIKIGYTFFGRKWWGGQFNPLVKALMLKQAFVHLERVQFELGVENLRSSLAMQKLGAVNKGKRTIAYHGEQPKENWLFEISKTNFLVGPLSTLAKKNAGGQPNEGS
jgi:RimJ/RimL family protein N-acetyltransferase